MLLLATLRYTRGYHLTHYIVHSANPLLLVDSTLSCGMYPTIKVAITFHSPWVTAMLACSVWMLVHCTMKCSRPSDVKSSSKVNLPFAWITGHPTHSTPPLALVNLISSWRSGQKLSEWCITTGAKSLLSLYTVDHSHIISSWGKWQKYFLF